MDIIQNTLVLIAGRQGVGKSVAAAMIAPDANYSADMYGQYDDQGQYIKEEASRCHAACLDDTVNAMIQGKKVIAVHNTFRTERQRIDYLIEARKHNYVVLVFEGNGGLYPSGIGTKNVHNVPDEIVDNFRWEPHQPPIPADDLDYEIECHADWFEVEKFQLWDWVKAMAKDDWKAVRPDVRKDAKFWRLVNGFRYWEESARYLAKKEILKTWGSSRLGVAQFTEFFDAYWDENPDFYKVPIKEISDGFAEFVRAWAELA